jgi:hypothetical protein
LPDNEKVVGQLSFKRRYCVQWSNDNPAEIKRKRKETNKFDEENERR